MTTTGVRPEMAVAGSTAEMLDAGKLLPRLNKLNDSGRLAQAIGEDAAAKLIQDVDKAARTKASAISRVKLAKQIAVGAATVGGAGYLGHKAFGILGGGH